MARKSRKNMMPQAAVQEAVQQNEKELLRTAAYARLSVENGGHETEDSLHTQILQIHNYIRENPELTLTDTYADNGFTGTRFDRPEFERMMQDVRTGKIQCIVVKDLSRFGRDYIETGSYLETIFPMLHVRFIAINDDFDNIRQSDVDSLAVPIKNMVNSLYAKDISKKISLSYQMRREKGIPTSWCTPYGYQLNQQGNKFEATEDAKWVKLIYQWYLAGVSTNEIARRLEFLEVARPNERLNRKLHEGDDPTYNKWHPSTVLRILNSSAYIGELVSGKTQTASYKGIGLHPVEKSSDIFVIYQIDNSEKNREYRCRSYEYQIQHGFMITADNYGTGYSGTASRGMGAEAIRKKMESINPDKFKIRKFGVSDVIGLTAAGKTSFFYVDKDRLVRFNGFFPKPQSGTYLILDEGGYQVAGQKGTWLVSDEVEVDGQRFVQMRSEQTKNPPPSIILHESGAFVTQTALGFDGEATRKMSAFLQGQKPELLHHQKFFENGTAERAKESGTEQNYNMIDGCVNNVPKKPRRIGGRWSVLDRLHIKQAERRQKDNAPQQEQERSRKS